MFPYRTRRILRSLGITLLALLLAAAVVLLCWMLWLSRFIVYTRDGAILDFNISTEFSPGEMAGAPSQETVIDIYYNEGENAIKPENSELAQLSGIYITAEMLAQDMESIKNLTTGLSADTAVMLDVKNSRGEFFYSSTLGKNSPNINKEEMDALIRTLSRNDRYLIARLPALRDYWHGLENVNHGLFNLNQLSLWMDDDRCYWLNPTSDGTLTYLIQIVRELKDLGFDEVVFTDFYVPESPSIYFEGDRAQIINATADSLVKICSTDSFAVSFINESESFLLPEGRSRLFFENATASDIAQILQRTGLENPQIRLVFLTALMDTRFEDYGVLRPIDSLQ